MLFKKKKKTSIQKKIELIFQNKLVSCKYINWTVVYYYVGILKNIFIDSVKFVITPLKLIKNIIIKTL